MLHERLRKSAARYPDKAAVRCNGSVLTYAGLDELSDRIAGALCSRGVGRGDAVALYLDRSADSIAALFGILKAGCAYVPLDTTAPAARIRYQVSDARAVAAITDHLLSENDIPIFFSGTGIKHILRLALISAQGVMDRAEIMACPRIKEGAVSVDEHDIAYILYTSGTTGDPKGVELTHRNALSFVDWACGHFGIGEADVLSNHAPLHFDLSVLDIFAAASTGAELCIVPQGLSCFPASLARFVADERITVWYSVPSVIVQMIAHGTLESKDLTRLRLIAYAGEALSFKYINALHCLAPRAAVANLYGLTETNVITCYDLPANRTDLDTDVPLGLPCPYADIRVVDGNAAPVADGMEGELAVSGDSVMRSYRGDETRTRQVLRTCSISGSTKQWLFTGDIVVRAPDGTLSFRSRRDDMVKVRGNRVSLSDVRAVLCRHEAVRECAVLAQPDPAGGSRLSAYIVLNGPDEDAESLLRAWLAETVPASMVPADIMFCDVLPKTSNGKIDTERLWAERGMHAS